MGSLTQPMPQTSELHDLLDNFLPQSGHIHFYNRHQPMNWGVDVEEGADGHMKEWEYYYQFRQIEEDRWERGWFLFELPLCYFLGETFEEACHTLEVDGSKILDDPLYDPL